MRVRLCACVSCHVCCSPRRQILGFSVSWLFHALSVCSGVCACVRVRAVESLSIFEIWWYKHWSLRLPLWLWCYSHVSSASSPGNQTNWWWFGPAGVVGNPPRFVLKRSLRMKARWFPLSAADAYILSSVPQSHSWQPGIKNPYRGVVVWPVPENVEITVTLFKVQIQTHLEVFLHFSTVSFLVMLEKLGFGDVWTCVSTVSVTEPGWLKHERPLYWLIGGQCLVTAVSVYYRSPTAARCKELHSLGSCAPCWLMAYTQTVEKRHELSTRVCDSELSE